MRIGDEMVRGLRGEEAVMGLPETIEMNLYPVTLRYDTPASEADGDETWWRGELRNGAAVLVIASGRGDVYLSVTVNIGHGHARAAVIAPTLIEAERLLPDAIANAMDAATLLRAALPAKRVKEVANEAA